MERLLDKIITVIFVVALGVIVYFIALWAKATIVDDNIGQNTNIALNDDTNYNYDDEHKIFDEEDTEYYDSQESTPREENIDELEEDIPDVESLYRDVPGATSTIGNQTAKTTPKSYEVNTNVITPASPKATSPSKVTTPKTVTTKTSTPKPTVPTLKEAETDLTAKSGTTTSSYGKFMVMAGSFDSKVNAQTHVDRLRVMGFNSIITSKITKGKFNVVAGSYATRAAANTIVQRLKVKKVPSYIRTRK